MSFSIVQGTTRYFYTWQGDRMVFFRSEPVEG